MPRQPTGGVQCTCIANLLASRCAMVRPRESGSNGGSVHWRVDRFMTARASNTSSSHFVQTERPVSPRPARACCAPDLGTKLSDDLGCMYSTGREGGHPRQDRLAGSLSVRAICVARAAASLEVRKMRHFSLCDRGCHLSGQAQIRKAGGEGR